MLMRLRSWNVNRRIKNIDSQISALEQQSCDIIALQEITKNSAPIFHERFKALGFAFVADSLQRFGEPEKLTGPRRYGVLVASRWPFEVLSSKSFDIPWHEKLLAVIIQTPSTNIALFTVLPNDRLQLVCSSTHRQTL
jgi:exonuclease III